MLKKSALLGIDLEEELDAIKGFKIGKSISKLTNSEDISNKDIEVEKN